MLLVDPVERTAEWSLIAMVGTEMIIALPPCAFTIPAVTGRKVTLLELTVVAETWFPV